MNCRKAAADLLECDVCRFVLENYHSPIKDKEGYFSNNLLLKCSREEFGEMVWRVCGGRVNGSIGECDEYIFFLLPNMVRVVRK